MQNFLIIWNLDYIYKYDYIINFDQYKIWMGIKYLILPELYN